MHKTITSNYSSTKAHVLGLVVPIRALHAGYREQILRHFLQLNNEDRHLRFGTQTPDEIIHHYVEHINFNQDTVFGSFDSDLNLIGMAHLAYLPKVDCEPYAAEFGVSVLPGGRGQGIGTALLERAAIHSRNTRIETLFVHCLANNGPMMRMAQKAGMQVEYAYGDADANLKLPPANTETIVQEAANEQWAGFDYAVKQNLKHANNAWLWFFGRPKIVS